MFDLDRKERRLEEVCREVENPDLWNNPEQAQKITKEKKSLEDLVGSFARLTSGISDARELFAMSLEEGDEAGAEMVAGEVEPVAAEVEKLEFKRMFNQPMDSANCYLEIQAGAGGTEAQ
ncbi:MAG TPA: peptide chain release factor 2, partial [Sutterella sp.]|nr:peptide chain release factor 2 [Sutterella sp.]